ncbi:C6 transcription factor [Penicillium angulare]|uniref:C6 transcription factor n=1 Tax=Penicillium angulare TaxID=116970 RepID=UPI002540AB94|nr:C6 transcription factor [Penicillium angulare]KAJ5279601.1 C6 transcription factor [Penicillium angulare]
MPRPAYSCTECMRRKLRCSKEIPCSACIERGNEHECRLRPQAEKENTPRRVRSVFPGKNKISTKTPSSQSNDSTTTISPFNTDSNSYSPLPNNAVAGVGQDAAVTLEFLAMSRRQVLQDAHVDEVQLPEGECHVVDTAELLFTPQQVERLMMYHQEYIAWTHNVVHLPTFRSQCEAQFKGDVMLDGTWVALFYAMLAVSLFIVTGSVIC